MENKKKCPHCGEMIAAEAKKCKFCCEWVNVSTEANEAPETKGENKSSKVKGVNNSVEDTTAINEGLIKEQEEEYDDSKDDATESVVSDSRNGWDYFCHCMKLYASFKGRARRKEFWYFQLFYFLFIFVAIIVDLYADLDGVLSAILILLMFLPDTSVSVRRLHDLGYSGWWYVIFIILDIVGTVWSESLDQRTFWARLLPHIGTFIFFGMVDKEGEPQNNKWGPNPKAGIYG